MHKAKLFLIGMMVLVMVLAPVGSAVASDGPSIRFSCSAQLFDILQDQTLEAFSRATGINVDLNISSSEAALFRIYNSVSDVAGTAERLYFPKGEYGYIESQICKAPIVVITHPDTAVGNLTCDQLRDIFSGKIITWEEVGGAAGDMIVVVPDKHTAAYRNFSQLALKRFDINYSIMTYRSTMVIEVVRHIPGSISFITKGANSRDAGVKILKVDGIAHTEENYPCYQIFSLVSRGAPQGSVKAFVDFIRSNETAAMLRDNGIFPIEP